MDALPAPAALVVVTLAYLVGSFHTADLVGRRFHVTPRGAGSGNPGASNVARLAGWRAGALVLVGDAAKGAVAATVGIRFGGPTLGALAATAAVVGHVLPPGRHPFRSGRGGKGVATALGGLLASAPPVGGAAVVLWGCLALVTRRASAASVGTVVASPLLLVADGASFAVVAPWCGVAALVTVAHRRNLVRLRSGTEPRIGRTDRLH